MQASIDAAALKPFTRALTCLSKYGDDLSIHATPDTLSLSTTNSSLSAYCRFRYGRQFFARYHVGEGGPRPGADGVEEVLSVTGQLLTKSLLSILKHRTMEKTVDRCDLSIVEGGSDSREDEGRDSLESKLVVRLHCKHGVIKTHRLPLLTSSTLMTPSFPDGLNESRLAIGPKTLKDMIDHFPATKTAKNDPQLVWEFDTENVRVRSVDLAADAKGSTHLSTELTISSDEFDHYDVYVSPISLAFHLREFNATIAYAESMTLALELKFTDAGVPLFIDVESDGVVGLCVVSTSRPGGVGPGAPPPRKRTRDGERRVVERTDAAGLARRMAEQRDADDMPPPLSMPLRDAVPRQTQASQGRNAPASQGLYAPASQSRQVQAQPSQAAFSAPPSQRPPSQVVPPSPSPAARMSAADAEVLHAAGFGEMDVDEFRAMLEDEGEEVGVGPERESLELFEDDEEVEEDELGPTQSSSGKAFKPLFDD
ncbi:hypothetical protein FA95DRAFT_1583033 [Auriscalpium vulgare]|uniref:Uncharacterized protein n=1 Tax=Auriscalpium vulgare TaxID=40419 RepID=A0ACB8RQK8_9AGAM|nr:hypothetical protein FA95DRAFT_1583033 [Auriscalpium vulgare]